MNNFTLGELSVAVAGVIGALVMCVRQVQQSKCTEVRCCCVECTQSRSPIVDPDNPEQHKTLILIEHAVSL